MSSHKTADTGEAHLRGKTVGDGWWRVESPSVSRPLVQGVDDILLSANWLESTDRGHEGSEFVVTGDLLGGISSLDKDRGDVSWKLSVLGHIDLGGLELSVWLDWQTAEHLATLLHLEIGDEDVSLTSLVTTAGTSDPVDVLVTVWWETDLDNVGDTWEIHSTGSHIRGDEDGRWKLAEALRNASTLLLGELAVHLHDLGWVKWVLGTEVVGVSTWGAKVLEDTGVKVDVGGGGEVDDGLEWAGLVALVGLLDLLGAQLDKSWRQVLEVVTWNNLLWNLLVGWCLVWVDSLDELEVLLESRSDQAHDLAWNSGGEEKGLSVDLLAWWENLHDLLNVLGETLIQETIGLVEDDRLQAWCRDLAVWVGEEIIKTTWSGNKQVAALALHLVEHLSLVGSTDGDLHLDGGTTGDLLGLNGDLLSQLASRRDDDGADVGCACALVSAWSLRELRGVLDDGLDDWNEETKSLSGSGSCLCNAVAS